MKRFLPAAILLVTTLAHGQSSDSRVGEIGNRDRSQFQNFVVATDEVARKRADGLSKLNAEKVSPTGDSLVNDPDAKLVLYPSGKARTEANRRLLTGKILLQTKPGANFSKIISENGNPAWEKAANLPNHYILRSKSSRAAMDLVVALRQNADVKSANLLLAKRQERRAAPNDPLFLRQWHLRNRGQIGGTPGIDANVVPIWGRFTGGGIRGAGVTIGIVDDGVQFTHPDLVKNYNVRIDHDWNDNTPNNAIADPDNGDYHGTSVAGVAAATGNNGIGISGVAPRARLTSLRLIADYEDDSQEAEAFNYRSDLIAIKNNSWGPQDDGQTMEGPGPLGSAALQYSTATGRGGLGTIFVWAAGNGREEGDNSNYDGYANSAYVIGVTSININGRATYYGEPGANVLIGAPSDNFTNSGIVTTDLVGADGYNQSPKDEDLKDTNYTRFFGGTSSAAPIVSGVAALMLQQNPRLGWRDVQEILIRTARMNFPEDSGWFTNAAGFHFNNNFGAGLIDGTGAVRLAATWNNLPPLVEDTQAASIPAVIPDDTSILEQAFTFSNNQRVEHVLVHLQISHPRRGDLKISVISPSGTVSELASPHADPNADVDWTYMTVHNWGESSAGVWRVQIQDMTTGNVGTLQSASITLLGSAL